MFCPECRAEYRDDITTCPDCEVTLVVELPLQPEFSDDDLVNVWETADVAALPVVKSVLRAAEIPFLVQGDETMGLFPVGKVGIGNLTSEGLGLAAVVLVPRDHEAEARALLTELPDTEADPSEG